MVSAQLPSSGAHRRRTNEWTIIETKNNNNMPSLIMDATASASAQRTVGRSFGLFFGWKKMCCLEDIYASFWELEQTKGTI